MRLLPFAVLLFVACSSSDPPLPPPDAGTDAALDHPLYEGCSPGTRCCVPDAVCACEDGATGRQACFWDGGGQCACPSAVIDAGSPVVDIPVGTDAPPPDAGFLDASDAEPARHDGCGLDPDGHCITPHDVAPDLGAPDVGMDAGSVDSGADATTSDAGTEDLGVDVPADRPDAVDGPRDAGPVVYDLDVVRGEMSAVLLWGWTCTIGCEGTTCDRAVTSATPAECHFASDGLHFSATACSTITGLVPLGSSTMGVTLGTGPVSRSTSVLARAGAEYVVGSSRRRNFHVQFTVSPSTSSGAAGIPGRTVSPTLGDVWLFGCRVE